MRGDSTFNGPNSNSGNSAYNGWFKVVHGWFCACHWCLSGVRTT